MKKCFLLLAVFLLLSGCTPVSREPDNLALVRVLGVDENGQVCLTAVCGKDGQAGVLRGKTESDSFEKARQSVVWSGEGKELSLTGVSYLVVSADADLESVLFAILEDADLGASATVWAAEQSAAGVLGGCDDPAADLELLALKGVKAPTVAQALAALTTKGEVTVPCLDAQNGRLTERGDVKWESGS